MTTPHPGRLELIVGPMFSGKSEELIPAILVLLVLALHSASVYGSEKTYEDGKLLSVNSPEVPLTIPPLVPSGPTVTFPLHLSYHFEVQQGDVVYIGYCQKRDCKAEWRVGRGPEKNGGGI